MPVDSRRVTKVTVVIGALANKVAESFTSEPGHQVIYGHTSPTLPIKETRYLTPYALHAEEYESHLSLFRAVKNRHRHFDQIIYIIPSPPVPSPKDVKGQRIDAQRVRDTLWALTMCMKVVTYHLRRDLRGGRKRLVLYIEQRGDVEGRTLYTAVLGFYRSLVYRMQLLYTQFNLVISQGSLDVNQSLLLLSGTYESPSPEISPTVHIISPSGSITSQSSEVGQVRGPSIELLKARFEAFDWLMTTIQRTQLRVSANLKWLRSKPIIGPLILLAPHLLLSQFCWIAWKVIQLDIRWAAGLVALAEIIILQLL